MTHFANTVAFRSIRKQPIHPGMPNPQFFWWAKQCIDCGFETTARMPGSNESMNATRAEERAHREAVRAAK